MYNQATRTKRQKSAATRTGLPAPTLPNAVSSTLSKPARFPRTSATSWAPSLRGTIGSRPRTSSRLARSVFRPTVPRRLRRYCSTEDASDATLTGCRRGPATAASMPPRAEEPPLWRAPEVLPGPQSQAPRYAAHTPPASPSWWGDNAASDRVIDILQFGPNLCEIRLVAST